ncbi:MAG: hypothetical protein ACO29V_03350 [Limnohabitans sp.]
MAFVVRFIFSPGTYAYLNKDQDDVTYQIKRAAVFQTEAEAYQAKTRTGEYFPFAVSLVEPVPPRLPRRTNRDTDA